MAKNPTLTTSSKNLKPVVDGIDNLPIPIGKMMDVQEEGNAMPEVNMSKNDGGSGDNVSSPPFANGKDMRSFGSSPSSDPTPAMPGA